jgi:ribonuclease-3
MDNIKNKLIKKEQIEELINKYIKKNVEKTNEDCEKFIVNNVRIFQNAFIHKDFARYDNDNSDEENYYSIKWNPYEFTNYEVLEFTGDRVIDLIIAMYIKKTYPSMDQGDLTKLKAKLVKKETLSIIAENLGFKKFMLLGSHGERISSRESFRFLEDIMEAFMGALFQDSNENFKICKNFILGVYHTFVDIEEINSIDTDYKSSLLKLFHSKKFNPPKYTTLYHTGSSFNREFTVVLFVPLSYQINNVNITSKIFEIIKKDLACVDISDPNNYYNIMNNFKELCKDSIPLSIGKGSTKKIAENECSKDCIALLSLNKQL